jgi:hypothetical protein
MLLDNKCKSFCKEDFGQGVCAGWEIIEGNCVSGGFCIISWKIFCLDGSETNYSTFDYCFQCPLYQPPGGGGGSTSQALIPENIEPN